MINVTRRTVVFVWTIAICFLHINNSFAQNGQSFKQIILFPTAQTGIMPKYIGNEEVLSQIRALPCLTDSMANIRKINITGYASPEGVMAKNKQLSVERAETIKKYILANYPFITPEKITTIGRGVDWEGLYVLVKNDENTPLRERVLSILKDASNDADAMTYFAYRKSLMELDAKVWEYMVENHFLYLRKGVITETCEKYSEQPAEKQVAEVPAINKEIIENKTENTELPLPQTGQTLVPETEELLAEETWKRPIAFKTNLLFDVATLLNIELEVPIGRRFSVAGEWMFPWWLWDSKQHCLEILSGNLEARYWLKPNYKKQDEALGQHNPLTGWFVGLYGGGGLYDLEWNKKGYQGEFYIATGISAGYVKPLSRNLSMEFSVGMGYMRTKYRHYNAMYSDIDNEWHLIRQNNGTYSWIGPTKVKVSLIWYPHLKTKKK